MAVSNDLWKFNLIPQRIKGRYGAVIKQCTSKPQKDMLVHRLCAFLIEYRLDNLDNSAPKHSAKDPTNTLLTNTPVKFVF